MAIMSLLGTAGKFVLALFKLLWRLAMTSLTVISLVSGAFLSLVRKATGGDGAPVRVRRDWNDHRIGTVKWSELRDPRWDTISGGEQNPTPQPFIHGYVWCNLVQGNIAHSCAHGPGPHNIKVCLVKKDNSREVWSRLSAIVGPKPGKRRLARR
jgi:hypothetical protein